MRCPQCQRKFRDRKALLCHMNNPSVSCRSHHFQEVINLADELRSYQVRRGQDQSFPSDDFTPPTTPEPMDIEAAVEESFREDSQNVDSGPFIEEYVGAAKEYGRGTTFMEKFDCDQYVEERKTNLYYPFASRDEWELAAFLLRSDLSMASIDSFLSLKLVSLVQHGSGPTLTALA